MRSMSFLKRLRVEIPCLVILDSDRNPDVKLQELGKLGISKDYAFILKEKEIEVYLLDTNALAQILSVKPEGVAKTLTEIHGDAKRKLETVFKIYGLGAPDSSAKALLARALTVIPDEIHALAERVRTMT